MGEAVKVFEYTDRGWAPPVVQWATLFVVLSVLAGLIYFVVLRGPLPFTPPVRPRAETEGPAIPIVGLPGCSAQAVFVGTNYGGNRYMVVRCQDGTASAAQEVLP